MLKDDEILSEDVTKSFKLNIQKLIKGVPIQYLINKQEFMGMEFFVDENVLIPQPDTEILVEETISIARSNMNGNITILDLCTGSGCIGISIAKYLENCDMYVSDISKSAIGVAMKNAMLHKVCISFLESDLFGGLANLTFDMIVSNPPYIKTDVILTLDDEVKNEPLLALDGGRDGLELYRRIIKEATRYLNKDGFLCLEIGYDQKDEILDLFELSGAYTGIYVKKDLEKNDRVVVARRG